MNIREKLEELEKKSLSSRAELSSNSKGRAKEIALCTVRTEFQRDKDRIIHCKSFRRLSHKTQVFLSPEGDHYRTRLTHTLEVCQISRTIARALSLNEDLAEAIALGHDLGHTPFGHEGEEALDICLQKIKDKYKGAPTHFEHNEQSLRVVDLLEYNGQGLNLTFEVRDGILNHTGSTPPATLEGQIVKIADRIAYVNHDIDDAVRGGIITEDDLPVAEIKLLGRHHGLRVNSLVLDMVENSLDKDHISLSVPFATALTNLRKFLFAKVYVMSDAKIEDRKVKQVIDQLFFYFLENPEQLPDKLPAENVARQVCDYIANMTDRYAIRLFQQLFVPKAWSL
ncbi:MAG: deoxyguanosinetriphosphate triphosphohydrolase [Actinobacteria bacterium]|nr:MAG: deoxyguanosinetriphosphate triphosphohydrolase [Actinomycetota bacterium]